MAEAIGLSALGSGSGTFSGGDTIIYDALVNGIGKVVTLIGGSTVNISNYNLMYYICSGEGNGDNPSISTTYGWIYNMSSFSTDDRIYISSGYFMIDSSSRLKLYTLGSAGLTVTCLLLKV